VVAAEHAARARGLELVGVWHSHPRGEALPSEADLRAAWRGWTQLIVAPSAERGAALRAWHPSESRLVERELAP
jgi:proteasome lid subunit RPN8/RPN11